jgi:hypothetical protein
MQELADFDRVEVISSTSEPQQYTLLVSGALSSPSIEIDLHPIVYIDRPEYWEVQVVATEVAFLPPPPTYFVAALPLARATGTLGVEVVGATRRMRRDVPPSHVRFGTRAWSAVHDWEPATPPILRVRGLCRVPAKAYRAELLRREPVDPIPDTLLLFLVVHEPEARPIHNEIELELRFEIETDTRYKWVKIAPDGISVDVKDVY